MKFQKAIAIALSVAALLTMTACGSTSESAATTAAATAEQTTEAPKSVSGTVSLGWLHFHAEALRGHDRELLRGVSGHHRHR